MFVSFLTVKPSPCKRFLVILNLKEQHYSTNSHGVLDATIDITIAPKMSDNYIPMNTFFVDPVYGWGGARLLPFPRTAPTLTT